MGFAKQFPCVICDKEIWDVWLEADTLSFDEGVEALLRYRAPAFPETEFMHIGGNMSAKAPNVHGLPGCRPHHREGPDSQESLKGRWGARWGLNVEGLIGRLRASFQAAFDLGMLVKSGPRIGRYLGDGEC